MCRMTAALQGSMESPAARPTRAKAKGKTRVHRGYSHNGCSRCKEQRTRCDEKQPSCGRCTRAGVECPGYVQQLKWSTKYEVFQTGGPKKRQQQQQQQRPKESSQPPRQGIPSPESMVSTTSQGLPTTISMDAPGDQANLDGLFDSLFPDHLSELPDISEGPDLSDLLAASPSVYDSGGTFAVSNLGPDDLNLGEDLIRRENSPKTSNEQSQTSVMLEPPKENTLLTSLSDQSKDKTTENAALVEITKTHPKAFNNNWKISPLSKTLNDPMSVLVEFYFKDTAQLFSCYDSSMNPFRTTISRYWQSSPLLHRTLSSMAATSLVEDFPQLGVLGKQLRYEAVQMLDKSTGCELESLLAMLMLGGSASWHEPSDVGLRFFNRLRKTLASMPAAIFEQHDVDYHFFHLSTTYWEMLLAYVVEDAELYVSEELPVDGCSSLDFVPHPWTGFAQDAQRAVQKVGRLIRRQRKRTFAHHFPSAAHIRQLEKDMATASELEEYLCGLSHPLENMVLDPNDMNTPVWHLLNMAEAYRATGLIQLYHVFPDLLDQRLAREQMIDLHSQDHDVAGKSSLDAERRSDWLTAYAVQVLGLIKSIPLESGTRDFQPFLLVSLSSELRIPATPIEASVDASQTDTTDQIMGITAQSIEVTRMRHFIRSRLNSFVHTLPPKPIRVCCDVVDMTWKRMDEKAMTVAAQRRERGGLYEPSEEIYWLDVIIENGWETCMA